MSHHLLVANPTAQSGKNAARIARAVALFEERGAPIEVLHTLPHGATIDAVRDRLRASRPRRVLSMGGDGTFREVASGLLDSGLAEEIPLGMLPTGTANDQGKSFGLGSSPWSLRRNVEIVLAGHETRLDAGRIENLDPAGQRRAAAWFFDSAGWGFSARVLAARNRDREGVKQFGPLSLLYRDQLVYAGALLAEFLDGYTTKHKFDVRVSAGQDERVFAGLTDLIVKNTRVYAGAWVFDRASRHDDGLFEVVPFAGKRDWTSKAIVDLDGNPITERMLNAVGIKHSEGFAASELELTFRPPIGGARVLAQIDGEEWPESLRVRVTAKARALRLVVPDPAQAPRGLRRWLT